MRLLAISDLHLGHPLNRENLDRIDRHRPWARRFLPGTWAKRKLTLLRRSNWLGCSLRQADLGPRQSVTFTTTSPGGLRGKARYDALVTLTAEATGVVTPEDPSVDWPEGRPGLCK